MPALCVALKLIVFYLGFQSFDSLKAALFPELAQSCPFVAPVFHYRTYEAHVELYDGVEL